MVKISDVTADGWILERLSAENLRFAGPVQSLGIKIGILIGFPAYMLLESSFDWITLPKYYFGMTCLLVFSIVFILFFTDETRPVGRLIYLARIMSVHFTFDLETEMSEDKELGSFEKLSQSEPENTQLTPWTILKCLLKGFQFSIC